MKNTWKLALAGLLMAGSVQAILFVDNYDVLPGSLDPNAGLIARQAAGDVTSTYTQQLNGHQVVGADGGLKLRRLGNTLLTLDTNFSSYLTTDFSWSFDFKAVGTELAQWTSIYLKNATDNSRGTSSMQVYFRGDNTTADLIHLHYGTGSAVSHAAFGAGVVNAALGITDFNIHDEHNYSFVATATDANSGTYDFLIDGIVVKDDLAYSFSEGTVRQIEFKGNLLDSRFDNLTVIPEPATLGMVAVFGTGILLIRRTFMI